MSIQAEQAVLYAILADNSKLKGCDLESAEFASWHHQEIYAEALAIFKAGSVVDPVTLVEGLRSRTGEGFNRYIAELFNGIPSMGSGFEDHCKMIRMAHRKRQAAGIANQLSSALESGSDFDCVDLAIRDLMALNHLGTSHEHSMTEVMHAALEQIQAAMDAGGMTGLTTGIPALDEALGGFHDTDLITVGARPAQGKTAFLLNVALAPNCPVGIISGEQGFEQLGQRLISIEGKVDSQKLRTASLNNEEWDLLDKSVTRLRDRKIRVFDESGPSIGRIMRQAREWKYRYDIKALYCDYIQKFRGSDKRAKRTEQVTEVVGELKNLARELKIPVIALAQVNRDCEKRVNKRPNMGDLADASEIEKESDQIMFLYRDEVYEPDSPHKGILEVDISKNRHGPIGTIEVAWVGRFMRLESLTHRYSDEEYAA